MSYTNGILLVVAIVGAVMLNTQATESKFVGTHTFYVGSAPCVKCHDSNITSHTGTPAHDSFTCNSCHRAEPNITYQSKNVSGHEAHAASKGSCANCHTIMVVQAPTTTLTVTPTLTVTSAQTETLTVMSSPTITMTQ